MKNPQFKYKFSLRGEEIILAIGESVALANGDIVKVEKYQTTELMNYLWFTINDGVWLFLEDGQRTINGKIRGEFERIYLKIK